MTANDYRNNPVKIESISRYLGGDHLRRDQDDPDFNSDTSRSGFHTFAPSLESLERDGLVVGGAGKFTASFALNESQFDPLKRLSLPSLTPNMGPTNGQLFANLGTNNRRGTDFIISIGTGEAKKQLAVNRLALSAIPFFDRMFADDKLKDGVLELPSHTVDAVTEALRFIYLNKVGVNLTRFLPSILSLAHEWDLRPLMVAVELDMIKKLKAEEQLDYDNAAEYFELAHTYDREVVVRVATCRLIDNWPRFILSMKGKNMKQELKDVLTCVMAAAAMTDFTRYPLQPLPTLSLTSEGRIARQLFANVGTMHHRYTDFVIAVGEEKTELHVSKLALTIVPFFDRLFGDDNWRENHEGVLHLPTHTTDAVMEALRFVYLNEVGEDLTRFLPSMLSLASEWELDALMTAIERDMITKLQADRFNYDYNLAADYFELAVEYDRKVVYDVAMYKLIDAWPQFVRSLKGKGMEEKLKDRITRVVAVMLFLP